jgi:uncharacterized sporulation protein YeaH/YhbH (DUF444 family)
MMIVDRRPNGRNKSAVNRQRFLRRYRAHIRRAVSDAVNQRSITDMDRGEEVSIPSKDVSEPVFRNGKGGRQDRVLPGNKEFEAGDRIKRPTGGAGGGGGGEASDSGEGIDDFAFQLSRDEFLDFMFEDLELPNMVKKKLKSTESVKYVRGGFQKHGLPARLNVIRSLRTAQGRRLALKGKIRKRISVAENELAALQADAPAADTNVVGLEQETKSRELKTELERLRKRLNNVPFLDEYDLRYNNLVEQPTPTSCAVMFCVMDVSGSMSQSVKDIAKRFFLLLHLFLRRHYEKTEVVFIRHHTRASEVDEQTFFYSRETGGTVVSSALKLMQQIIDERYPAQDWNIYVAQASDGDNWSDDSPQCRELLSEKILPACQYYTYVEITRGQGQQLWASYEPLAETFDDRFAMKRITRADEIFPVFRGLFERKET